MYTPAMVSQIQLLAIASLSLSIVAIALSIHTLWVMNRAE